jgi:hypothetical protein
MSRRGEKTHIDIGSNTFGVDDDTLIRARADSLDHSSQWLE